MEIILNKKSLTMLQGLRKNNRVKTETKLYNTMAEMHVDNSSLIDRKQIWIASLNFLSFMFGLQKNGN